MDSHAGWWIQPRYCWWTRRGLCVGCLTLLWFLVIISRSSSSSFTRSNGSPVSLQSAKSALYHLIHDPPWKHPWMPAVYEKYSEARDKREITNSSDAARLSQIRSGHCCAFNAYQHLMDSSIDPTCLECRQAPDCMEHWILECPALHEAREDIFGRQDLSLNVLGSDPQKVIALAEHTLFWQQQQQQQQQQQLCVPEPVYSAGGSDFV